MPQVVVAKPDANGEARNWDDVYPIWKQNAERTEWQVINHILEAVAINGRYGGQEPEELKARLIADIKKQIDTELEQTLKEFQALPNPETNGFGFVKNDDISPEHEEVIKKRRNLWAEYGTWVYYINDVIDNVVGTYREYK